NSWCYRVGEGGQRDHAEIDEAGGRHKETPVLPALREVQLNFRASWLRGTRLSPRIPLCLPRLGGDSGAELRPIMALLQLARLNGALPRLSSPMELASAAAGRRLDGRRGPGHRRPRFRSGMAWPI